MHVATRFCVATGCIDRATGRYRQLKGVNEQFGLELFREPCARIDYDFPGDRITGVAFKLSDPRRNSRQFLCRDTRQFPGHLRRVDLEKRKPQFLARTGKHL